MVRIEEWGEDVLAEEVLEEKIDSEFELFQNNFIAKLETEDE